MKKSTDGLFQHHAKRIGRGLFAFLFLLFSSSAYAQNPSIDRFLQGDEPFVLEADQVDYDADKEIYSARGSVLLRHGQSTLAADRIVVNLKEMTFAADGACVLKNPQGELRASSLRLNAQSETGIIVQGALVVHAGGHNYYFRGERIEKLSADRYRIQNGWYSTCDCGEDEADWFLEAEEIDITLDGYAVVRHGRLYAGGVPVAVIPYGVVPVKIRRQSGFLPPTVGWASDDGYSAGIPYFWAIDDHVDATIESNYYENRGLKEGLEYRYAYAGSTRGAFNLDAINDQRYGDRRWAMSYEHRQNPWRRLYLRTKLNTVSDNDYVNDFPRDITARYDRFLRSNVIGNYLWQNYDLGVDFEHFDDLDREDNSYTWQKLPETRFDAFSRRIADLPLTYSLSAFATNFSRQKIPPEERELDVEAGHERPYRYLTSGRRLEILPEVSVPMNFDRWAYWTHSFRLRESLYQLPDRRQKDRTPSRELYAVGSDLFTRAERVFPIGGGVVRALKHTLEPGVRYDYIPPADQEALPIFDGEDRVSRRNELEYYLSNRLWARLLPRRSKSFLSAKLVDLEISHSFDLHEAQRELPEGEERRPLGPIRGDLESLVTFGSWINHAALYSDLAYDLYLDRVRSFNLSGVLGRDNDDTLGAEYRYRIDEDRNTEIAHLSGNARYTVMELVSFSALARYSFTDEYFIERLYGVELHSRQNCWDLLMQVEQREIPEKELIYRLTLNMTGLFAVNSAF